MKSKVLGGAFVALALGIGSNAAAQSQPAADASPAGQEQAVPAPQPAAKPPAAPAIRRWLELQSGTIGLRYREIETSQGVLTNEQLQQNEGLKGRVKFDANGAYAVNFFVGTGSSFSSSWNDTGAGTGDPHFGDVHLRQLFLSAAPVKGLELQFGGLGLVRGESTEITTYDNDGFVTGSRATVKRPAVLFFDEISAAVGYLGPIREPGVIKRFEYLDDVNYRQFLVAKKLGSRAAVSMDYTYAGGADVFHQGLRVAAGELRVVDAVRAELYQRHDGGTSAGFAVTLDKALTRTLSLSGGYADIDEAFGGLNGDRYNRGRRFFFAPTIVFFRDLSVSGFVTRALDEEYAIANKTRFDVVAIYNVLAPLQRRGIF